MAKKLEVLEFIKDIRMALSFGYSTHVMYPRLSVLIDRYSLGECEKALGVIPIGAKFKSFDHFLKYLEKICQNNIIKDNPSAISLPIKEL